MIVLDVLKIIWKDTLKLFAFNRMALNLQAKTYNLGPKEIKKGHKCLKKELLVNNISRN